MGVEARVRRDHEVAGPSDRSFGLTFAAVFAIVAVLPLWRGAESRQWAWAVSLLLLVVSVVRPGFLAPANHVWLAIGLALHRIVNPIVLGVIFFVAVTPFAVVMRLLRPELARRMRPDPNAPSYWISRGSGASPMDQQF